MTSSATPDYLSDVVGNQPVPARKLAYFETRLRILVNQTMLKIFSRLESERKFTRRDLARKIRKKPEQITHWLSYPQNLTLGTLSNLLTGTGYELSAVVVRDLATGKTLQVPEPVVVASVTTFRVLGEVPREQSIVAPQSAQGAAALAGINPPRGRAELAGSVVKPFLSNSPTVDWVLAGRSTEKGRSCRAIDLAVPHRVFESSRPATGAHDAGLIADSATGRNTPRRWAAPHR